MASQMQCSPAFDALVQATAGAVGGIYAASMLQPLEVVRTKIQLTTGGGDGDSSMFQVFSKLVREGGPLAVYRGVTAKAVETGAKNFVYFYIFYALTALAKKRKVHMTTPVRLLIGYSAGVINTMLTTPLEVISTRCQAAPKNMGTLAVMQELHKNEGLAGFFRGFWFNVVLCVNPAIQNTVFDCIKDGLLGMDGALSARRAFLLGAFAKAVATFSTFPLSKMKTMLQACKACKVKPQPLRQASIKALNLTLSPTSTLGKRLDIEDASTVAPSTHDAESCQGEEGILLPESRLDHVRGVVERVGDLYRGIQSTLLKSVLQAALLYMTKESVEGLVRQVFKAIMKIIVLRSRLQNR